MPDQKVMAAVYRVLVYQVISFFIFPEQALQRGSTEYLAQILKGLGGNPAEREVTITALIPLKDT